MRKEKRMVICFIFNVVTFLQTTAGYRTLLSKTVQDSIPLLQSSFLPRADFPVDTADGSLSADIDTNSGVDENTAVSENEAAE